MRGREPEGSDDVASPAGFSRFYRDHVAVVYGYALRLCGGDRASAEDLTQETFLALTAELRRGRRERADIRWLVTVTRSRYLDHLRREERRSRHLRLATAVEPETDAGEPSVDDVLEQLASVEPLHRAVLMMRYVDGLDVDAIASEIGRTVSATYSLLARARGEVRAARGAS